MFTWMTVRSKIVINHIWLFIALQINVNKAALFNELWIFIGVLIPDLYKMKMSLYWFQIERWLRENLGIYVNSGRLISGLTCHYWKRMKSFIGGGAKFCCPVGVCFGGALFRVSHRKKSILLLIRQTCCLLSCQWNLRLSFKLLKTWFLYLKLCQDRLSLFSTKSASNFSYQQLI